MTTQTLSQKASLAIDGGAKAFPGMRGTAEPKIGVEEFLAIARRFGFNEAAMDRLREAVGNSDLPPGGPNLARYIMSVPPAPAGAAYEKLACELFGVRHALGVSSGTGALHGAFAAVGVGPGCEVIVPAIGFLATSAAVALCGGVPVFCDVDRSLQMDPAKIEPLITPRTVAVAPTHHWGGVCDMDPVLAVARRHNLKVVEDCAQSPGAKYKGRFVGTIGDIGCFSISAYKIIGGGEGGLVITNDQRLHERASQLSECGGLWRSKRFAQPQYDGELFVGTNYRLSELESAIDQVQLRKLEGIVARHRNVHLRILRQLKPFAEIMPQKINDPDGEIGYLMRFFPQSHDLGRKIVAALKAEGVSCSMRGSDAGPDWHLSRDMFPVILKSAATAQSPFNDPRYLQRGGKAEYRSGDCPVAEDLYNRAISIGLNQWYSPEDCDAIAAALNKVFSAYCTQDAAAVPWV